MFDVHKAVTAIVVATLLALGTATAATAKDAGLVVTKKSAHSVTETLDRLQAILEKRGITVFARVDHGAGAKKVGVELPETQLLIFGNPKLGSPLMASNRAVGLDLPMKALAWADADGTVFLSYTAPQALKARHNVTDRDKIFAMMTGALDKLTNAATKAE